MYKLDQNLLSKFIERTDWESCWSYLDSILEACQNDDDLKQQMVKDSNTEEGRKKLQSHAALISTIFIPLLTEDVVTISDELYIKLIYKHETLHDIFFIAGIEDTDSYLFNHYHHLNSLTSDQQKKLCLLLSLNTSLNIKNALKNVSVMYRGIALTSYLANKKHFHGNNEKNKIKLLDFSKDIQDMPSIPEVILKLNQVYFRVSYIEHDGKHKIKSYINEQIKKYIAANQDFLDQERSIAKIPSDDDVKNRAKPVLLICAEHFDSNHAMYRSWGKRIRTLNKYFDLHLLVNSQNVDHKALSEFKNYILTDKKSLDQIILGIEYLRPDMILMPSVGMDIINIILSNLRLAPLQTMLLGHPAATMSQEMDFVLGIEDLFDKEAFFNDTYIVDPTPVEHHPISFLKNMAKTTPKDGNKTKEIIACVPGSLPKISAPFWTLLEKMRDNAEIKIRYVFLTDSQGTDTVASKLYIQKQMPDSEFYNHLPYEEYFEKIKNTDIALFPFPFGHSNTVIDCLLAGKPCVGMYGQEPHSKTNGAILERAGVKEQFLAYDPSAYEEKFFSLCREIKEGKRNFFSPQEIYDRMYARTEEEMDFGAFVYWVYKNQNEMKSSGQQLFSMPNTHNEKKKRAAN